MTLASLTEDTESPLQLIMGLHKNFQMQKLLMIRLACIQVGSWRAIFEIVFICLYFSS